MTILLFVISVMPLLLEISLYPISRWHGLIISFHNLLKAAWFQKTLWLEIDLMLTAITSTVPFVIKISKLLLLAILINWIFSVCSVCMFCSNLPFVNLKMLFLTWVVSDIFLSGKIYSGTVTNGGSALVLWSVFFKLTHI